MPYTPPSPHSPASSKSNSPVMSRSSSYHQDDIPRSPVASRPQPPRSHSSTYLHKHRRTPSITKAEEAPLTSSSTHGPNAHVSFVDFAGKGSVRQSPPPVNNLRIPTGAVISPPDSSENSDGDEGNAERGRELEQNWDQLQQAVWALPRKRDGSPEKAATDVPQQQHEQQRAASNPTSQSVSPTALSAEARKISHSRSSTETKIMLMSPTFVESPIQTTDSSDDEDNIAKPALVRKKSGELVKPALRPSSRRRYSSMPGTPTYAKSVHFNDNDNQTRHFLQVDKPIAVSAGSSPVETHDSESEFPFSGDSRKPELEIKVANFPRDTFERQTMPVRMERLFLSADKTTLVGLCAVQNIAFHKQVVARFTLDYWKTTSEVVAEYNNDIRHPPIDGGDRFNFHIKLTDQANIDNKTLLLCVRYNVGGQEFWDNNNNTNYQVDFTRGERKPAQSMKPTSALGQRPLNAIPRSRHTHAAPSMRPKNESSVDDDFVSRFDTSSAFHFGGHLDKFLGDPQSSIKLKQRSKRPAMFASSTSASPVSGLGSRYDFGNSLSAALSSAQVKLGPQNGPARGSSSAKQPPSDIGSSQGGYFGLVERTEPAKAGMPTERPDSLTEDRPAIGSDQYKDLVQKFCYFTPGPGKTAAVPPQPNAASPALPQPQTQQPEQTEEQPSASDAKSTPPPDSAASSARSSGTSSPVPQVDGVSEKASGSDSVSYFISRSTSPSPSTGHGYGRRSASPVSFGYPYHSHRDGYLSDTPRPTAIHG